MGHRSRRVELSIRALTEAQYASAVKVVAEGSVQQADWDALSAFVARDGIDAVAQALARHEGFEGASREWWRCMLLLASELTSDEAARVARELVAIEEARGGPTSGVGPRGRAR